MDVVVTFTPGLTDGAMMCANISLASDMMVECEEDFTVNLELNTIKDNLGLGSNSTRVTLVDSDCKLSNLA